MFGRAFFPPLRLPLQHFGRIRLTAHSFRGDGDEQLFEKGGFKFSCGSVSTLGDFGGNESPGGNCSQRYDESIGKFKDSEGWPKRSLQRFQRCDGGRQGGNSKRLKREIGSGKRASFRAPFDSGKAVASPAFRDC